MENLSIPYNFHYREYQKPILKFMRKWGKRAILVWHRRAWKDKAFFNLAIECAIREVWGYAYILPTYAQGKKVIWDSIDKEGKRFKDHIPKELLAGENGTELKFTLKNGSFIQVLGSENIDSLRGISPKGIFFSEYAFQNPTVWDVMRPILAENGGFAVFNSTPNGKNHFWDMWNMANEEDWWFKQKLSVLDTWAVSQEYIESERRQGMSEEMIQQEYFVSFDVGAIGSYYADLVWQARNENRICQLPFNKDVPIDLFFDLGVNDSFTISFKQNDWQFFNFINYYEENGKTLEHYFYYIDDYISRKSGKLGKIYLPHDSAQKGQSYLVAGKTIIEKFQDKYWQEHIQFIPNKVSVNDGIQEARRLFPRVRFDIDSCQQFIRCLENYKKDWDDIKKIFRDQPRHDWASHGADNFRYFSVSWTTEIVNKKQDIAFEIDYSDFY